MNEKKTKPKKRFYDTWTFTILIIVVVPLVLRTFLYSPFHIPSGSMKPNLLIGDYIFVSKYSYGYSRYSMPFGVNLIEGRVFSAKPERGDIIVFKQPSHPSVDYIKRLVGLPGDKVQVIEGLLYINGEAVKTECDGSTFRDEKSHDGEYNDIKQCVETLPNGVSYKILDETSVGGLDNTQVFEVPQGYYFFMGDNRDNSMDSRVVTSVGYVPEINLVGKARWVVFSMKGSSWEFWEWPFLFRGDRFFKTIK